MSNVKDLVHFKLALLDDVDVASVAVGQYISWNGSKFVPVTPPTGGGGTTYGPATESTLGLVRVGTGLTIDEAGVLSAPENPAYLLPQATTVSLGGVKVGTGLAMEPSTGRLSVIEGAAGGWVDKLSQRSGYTVYQNTSANPIAVFTVGVSTGSSNMPRLEVDSTTNFPYITDTSSRLALSGSSYNISDTTHSQSFALVPAGYYYRFYGAANILIEWFESA